MYPTKLDCESVDFTLQSNAGHNVYTLTCYACQ